MKSLKINDIDYRNILIQSYKELNLTENELIVLLLIDSLSKEKMSLFSGEMLSVKMNLTEKEIDETIVSLMNKSFLSYVQQGDILVTSLENTFKKVLDLIQNQIVNDFNDDESKYKQEALGNVLRTLETEMKRSLTSLEMEKVANWFQEGVDEKVINDSINECIMKNNRVTITKVDHLIIKNLTHTDREQEGFTTVDEKTKKDIKKAMDIAAYDWVNRDEN